MHLSRSGSLRIVTVAMAVAMLMADGSPLYGQPGAGPTPVFLPLVQAHHSGTTDPSPDDYLGVAVHGAVGDSNQNEIYTVRGDGSHIRQLTGNAVADEAPDLSPDGTRIAYQRQFLEPEIRDYILVSDVNGGDETPFDAGGFRALTGFQWQPQSGNLLAFGARGINAGVRDLLLFAPDGSVEVVYRGFSASVTAWGWSPDGRYIYLAAYDNHAYDVWVTTADRTAAWRHAGEFLGWHPTRQALLIQSTVDPDHPTLELVPPLGGESERLYTGPYDFNGWLRHGQAFLLKDTYGDGSTYIHGAHGTLTELPDAGQGSTVWGVSPDGNAIFYSTSTGIYYHSLDPHHTIVLEDDCPSLCSPRSPSWAQDGSGLVYINSVFFPDPPRTFTEAFYVNLQDDTPEAISLFYRPEHWKIAYLPGVIPVGNCRRRQLRGGGSRRLSYGTGNRHRYPFPLFRSGHSIQ